MTDTSTAVPYKITHRYSDRVVYQATKATTAADAVMEAVASGANLAYADLAYADLAYADLAGADLAGARLDGARLEGAKLAGARLGGGFIAATNDIAYVGPVGDGRRPVYAFRAKADKGTVIVYRCGCFIGTAAQYRKRIIERCGNSGQDPNATHLAECKVALAALTAMTKTWPKIKKGNK